MSSDQQRPTFSLIDMQSEYCITCCDKDEKAGFAVSLYKLSSLTWREISTSSRHGLGYERIALGAIKAPIPHHITDDVTLIAFRFSGKKAMVGYREQAMFHILWLDRNFTQYDHS